MPTLLISSSLRRFDRFGRIAPSLRAFALLPVFFDSSPPPSPLLAPPVGIHRGSDDTTALHLLPFQLFSSIPRPPPASLLAEEFFSRNQKAMSENPLKPLINTFDSISCSLQTHLSRFLMAPDGIINDLTVNSLFSSLSIGAEKTVVVPSIKEKEVKPLTKEELGRATWTLLHSIAAQYPDQPTRKQRRDAKELLAILSRMYPCKECQDHFKEILKGNPVQAGSQEEFAQWLCHVHNVVNRSLGKVSFPCQRVNARWGKLDCKDRSCDLDGSSSREIDIKY